MDYEPDSLEKGIRFGCGGILGFLFGLYVAFNGFADRDNTLISVLTIAFLTILFGVLAMKQGDRFWSSIRKWF